MLDGARFLGAGLGSGARVGGRYRAKVLGNGLRELDRFLSVLLDEIALAAGWGGADLRALVGLRDTAAKLALVYARSALPGGTLDRLRALGRCRNMLFYCEGVVRRGDHRHAHVLTRGWPAGGAGDGAAATLVLGDDLAIDATELAWICAFYIRIGDQIVRQDFVRPAQDRLAEHRPARAPAGPRFPAGLAADLRNGLPDGVTRACEGG